ncbi:MAG TPA: hypothetical protein VK581_10005 [Chthoniobacterales bacterium]|nr:hypothetical protein [Chthoniobacterales bacterium]
MKALLLRAAIVLMATCVQLEAKAIRYPQKGAMFRITIPDDWIATWEKDGSLKCVPPNRSKYVSVFPSANFKTKAELKAQLPAIARDSATGANIKDLKLRGIKELNRNPTLLSINADGTSQGNKMVFTLVAFAPNKDNTFTVIALEPRTAHDNAIASIINSISSER